MDTLSISIASVNDVPQLMQLVNSAYRGEKAKKGWTHEAELIDGSLRTDISTLRSLLQNPSAVILKCTDSDNNINGCVYLEKQNNRLYLGMLSVSPEQQAKGIGKQLLKAAENYARQNNCVVIEMTVISVRHELVAWYKRHGYMETGDTKPFPEDDRFGIPVTPIELAVLEKRLGNGV